MQGNTLGFPEIDLDSEDEDIDFFSMVDDPQEEQTTQQTSDTQDEPKVKQTPTPTQENDQEAAPAAPQEANEDDILSDSANPLADAMDKAEETEAAEAQQSLFAKLPLFEFAGASERIENPDITFEELRQQKVADFPEMEKKTTWTVSYGKTVKSITDPKKDKIADIKREIETSQSFIDGLKKSKDKNPDCKVTPRVAAEKKGVIRFPAYKGIYSDVESAVNSGKLISLIPAKDGRLYELRRNELGEFVTPTSGHRELDEIQAGFSPHLPLVPKELLLEIITFFRTCMFQQKGEYEASAHIVWDRYVEEFSVYIPEQRVTKASVHADINLDTERYVDYISLHSHNSMKAYFSLTDDADEKATKVYAVIGRLHNFFPQMKVRICNGGNFLDIDPNLVFESVGEEYPPVWLDNVSFEAISTFGEAA